MDNETYGDGNAYNFGARIQDSRLGKWLSVDPLQRKYPSQTTYGFTANNPVLYVDRDGKEVFIYGVDAERAVAALKKSTSLTISYNVTTGQLTATGTPSNPADQKLLDAILDPNIRVEAYTTKGTVLKGQTITGGAYEGSKVETVTDNAGTSKTITITKQIINVDQLEKIGTSGIAGTGSTGDNVKHEVLESYIGGQDDPGGTEATGYKSAHAKALTLDPKLKPLYPVVSGVNGHTYLTPQNPQNPQSIDFSKDVIDMGRPEMGWDIPSNPSRRVPDGGTAGGTGGKTSNYPKK